MIIDVTKTRARSVRTVLVAGILLVASSLCWGYLHAADTPSAKTKAEVKAILAIKADPDYGEYLAGECQTCHVATSDGNIPGINGRDAGYIVTALIEYRNNDRDNETMRSVAGALGSEEMAAIAAYYSELPK